MGWYSEVSRDISKIPDAIQYFETELVQARAECKLVGNVEKSAAAMPGIVEHRFNQLQGQLSQFNNFNLFILFHCFLSS